MKKLLSIVIASLMMLTTVSITGCGNGSGETPADVTLNVYILDAGYKTEWLDGIKAEFAKQEWVVEKYGNVDVDVESNGVETYGADKIRSGNSKANKFDLLFGMNLQELYGEKNSSTKKYYLADLSDVYKSTVPGESITVEKKMIDSAVSSNLYTDKYGKSSWFAMPWAGGYNGILYNADKLAEAKYEVPVTTDELLAIMQAETEKEKKVNKDGIGYSIMQSMDEGATYWEHLMPTWWAQYEGYTNYEKFWEGKTYNPETEEYEYSVDIFKQKGRLESLTVLENAIRNNLYHRAASTNYITAQRMFVKGDGMFMACGDWFDMEMKELIDDIVSNGGKAYNVQMMKTPVISAIIDRLTTVKDDATLSKVVKAVDGGAESFEGVSAEDFKIIKEARNILYSVGNYHTAVIPEYAKNVELAKDFLRFMATDKANEIYSVKTGGSGLFFEYDLESKNPSIYETLSETAKMRIRCFNDEDSLVLPIPNNFNLFIYGRVRPFKTNISSYEYLFTQPGTSAQDVYDYDISYYTETEWETILFGMGVEI